MTPHVLEDIRRLFGRRPSPCHWTSTVVCLNMGVRWEALVDRLTVRSDVRHNFIYYGFPIIPTRCQSRRLARPRHAASSSPSRPGPAVRLARLFRSAGSRAGEVRNAPSGGRRGRPRGAHGRRLWGLAPDVLSDADRLQATEDRRPGTSETRAA